MRRVLIALALLALAGGAAQAQNWFGVRSGYPLGVTLHYGVPGDAFDYRFSGRVVSVRGDTRVGFGVDALRTLGVDGDLRGYAGGGPAVEVGGGDAVLDVHALAGGAFRFRELGLDPLAVFAEISLGGQISLGGERDNTRVPTLGAAIGVDWYF